MEHLSNLQQPLAYRLTTIYQTPATERALRDVAYLSYMLCEQADHHFSYCQTLYHQLIDWEFKADAENVHEMCHIFSALIEIGSESLRMLNGRIEFTSYQAAFLNALEKVLPESEAIHPLQKHVFCPSSQESNTRSESQAPLTANATQSLAKRLQKRYEAEPYPQRLIEQWQDWVSGIQYDLDENYEDEEDIDYRAQASSQGKIINNSESYEYQIHYQAFMDYTSRPHELQRIYLTAMTYAMARMIQLVEQHLKVTQSDQYPAFLASVGTILGVIHTVC